MILLEAVLQRTRSFNQFASLLGDMKADAINFDFVSRNWFRRIRICGHTVSASLLHVPEELCFLATILVELFLPERLFDRLCPLLGFSLVYITID